MKDRIVLVDFYCDNCECEINGSINSPKEYKNEDNKNIYTHIRCPYCQKNFYIKNENGKPIKAVGDLRADDLLTDDDNPNFEIKKEKESNIEDSKK